VWICTPNAIASVEGTDVASMDAVIDKIVKTPNVLSRVEFEKTPTHKSRFPRRFNIDIPQDL
jgi:hypothetical protein